MSATTPSAWLFENDSLRAKSTRGALAWLAIRESASRRSRVLPIPGAPVTVTTIGVRSSTLRSNAATICASSASRPTKGAPPHDLRLPAQRGADDRAPVAAELQLVAATRQLGRRRVGEDLPARRVAREGRGPVDHLAGRPRAVDSRAARRDCRRSALIFATRSPRSSARSGLVADGLAHAEVRTRWRRRRAPSRRAPRARRCVRRRRARAPSARAWRRSS